MYLKYKLIYLNQKSIQCCYDFFFYLLQNLTFYSICRCCCRRNCFIYLFESCSSSSNPFISSYLYYIHERGEVMMRGGEGAGGIINNISIYLCTHNVTPQQQHTLFAGTSRLLLLMLLYGYGVDDLCITCCIHHVVHGLWIKIVLVVDGVVYTHTQSFVFERFITSFVLNFYKAQRISARRDILLLTCQFIYYILTFIILIRLYIYSYMYSSVFICALEPIAWIDFFLPCSLARNRFILSVHACGLKLIHKQYYYWNKLKFDWYICDI